MVRAQYVRSQLVVYVRPIVIITHSAAGARHLYIITLVLTTLATYSTIALDYDSLSNTDLTVSSVSPLAIDGPPLRTPRQVLMIH